MLQGWQVPGQWHGRVGNLNWKDRHLASVFSHHNIGAISLQATNIVQPQISGCVPLYPCSQGENGLDCDPHSMIQKDLSSLANASFEPMQSAQ